MKELVVVSGKGGTGKTSVVASFAALARDKVIADCDVDAADLRLVLGPVTRMTVPFSGGKVAVVRAERCTGCGDCGDACRFGAVVSEEQQNRVSYRIDATACEGCGVCRLACPVDAVDLVESVNGEWFVSDTRHGPFVHARLGIAEENSGKLVTLVRREARNLAEAEGLELVLVDGSPGIGCPVIASMAGARLALAVTEPTLSGLHDLRRVAGVAEKLGVPRVVTVNKWDLSPDTARDVEEWCAGVGLPVIGSIPYDDAVTEAQIAARAVTECSDGAAAEAISGIWDRLEEML
jgi:MinD superfamily P-loop ATPase